MTRSIIFAFNSISILLLLILFSTLSQKIVDSSNVVSGRRVQILPDAREVFMPLKGTLKPAGALTCKPEGDDPKLFSNVRWAGPNRLDNHLELQRRHQVFETRPNSNEVRIRFLNPTEDDYGTYYCLGTYQSSETYNASIKVMFVHPLKIELCPSKQLIIKGKNNFRINCHITGGGHNSLEIFKDGVYLTRVENDADGFIIDSTVSDKDAGKYKINIDSQGTGETDSVDIEVDVASYPEFEHDNTTSTGVNDVFYGVEGERAELRCKASGMPKPLITWLSPRKKNLTLDEGYSVNQVEGTLQIHRVNKYDDLGDFLCKAYNSIGTIEKNVTMNVYSKPNIILFTNKTVDEDSEVTFECRVTGEPKPEVSIRRDPIDKQQSQPYMYSDKYLLEEDLKVEEAGSIVYIYRAKILAKRENFGRHYCKATNRAGTTDERVAYLFVQQKPDLSLTPPVQYINPELASITCHIVAYPPPIVTWLLDDRQIINLSNHTVTKSDGRTHIINLQPIVGTQNVYSRYTCRAENHLGSNKIDISLRIISRPGFIRHEFVEFGPTWFKLKLDVPEDNGDKVKYFKYRAIGRTLNPENPTYTYKTHDISETYIDASLDRNTIYTIKNLYPYYTYSFSVRAVNIKGESDELVFRIDTRMATKPDAPTIIRPSAVSSKDININSDYENGYLLRWSPPSSDNGDPVIKYIIKFRKDDNTDVPNERTIEQMSERPLEARLGPLEVGQRYRIEIQAQNRYGNSDSEYVLVQTIPGRQVMVEFEPPQTIYFIVLGIVAVVILIMIDLIFCVSCGIGFSHWIYNLHGRYGLVEDTIK